MLPVSPTRAKGVGSHPSSAGDPDILRPPSSFSRDSSKSKVSRQDSARWTDRYFNDDQEFDSQVDCEDQFDDSGIRALNMASSVDSNKDDLCASPSLILASTREVETGDFLAADVASTARIP